MHPAEKNQRTRYGVPLTPLPSYKQRAVSVPMGNADVDAGGKSVCARTSTSRDAAPQPSEVAPHPRLHAALPENRRRPSNKRGRKHHRICGLAEGVRISMGAEWPPFIFDAPVRGRTQGTRIASRVTSHL
ncbi:hypothetical protein MTO96_045425 [Rhipicephalus appendiculatus]